MPVMPRAVRSGARSEANDREALSLRTTLRTAPKAGRSAFRGGASRVCSSTHSVSAWQSSVS